MNRILFTILYFLSSSLVLHAQRAALFGYLDSLSTKDYKRTFTLCDSLLKGNPTPKEEGILYRYRARALYFDGQYDKAAQQFAVSINRLQSEDRERGLTLIEQARLFRKIKMYEEANNVYQRAEDIFSRLNDSLNLGSVWNEWGVVYELQHDYAQALRLYRKSLRMKESLHDSIGIAYSHSFISTGELGQKNYDKAVKHGLYALHIFEKLGDPFPVAVQCTDLAALFQKEKEYPTALAYLRRSDSLAKLWDYKELRAENYRRRAALYMEMGKCDSAFALREQYALLRDSIFTENSQKIVAELNARYALAEKDAALQKQEKEKERSTFAALFIGLLLLSLGIVSFFVIRNQRLRNRALVREHFYKEELARKESEKRLAEQRNHISRELHDNIGSYLTFISSSIDRIESPRLRANDKIRTVKELTQETIIELRKTVWLLNKPALSAFDWQLKLREYYRRFPEVHIRATPATEGVQMTSEQATHLFRIVQEAINNALKYSGAPEIDVTLDFAGDFLRITIHDNGCGFAPNDISQGFGMTTMRQRTEVLGGSFELESAPGEGVLIRLQLPFQAEQPGTQKQPG